VVRKFKTVKFGCSGTVVPPPATVPESMS